MVGEHLHISHQDLDEMITERANETIATIVEQHGWDRFRDLEHETLKDFLTTWNEGILSLGGGCVAFERNRNLLSSTNAKLIYIDVSPAQQLKHVSEDSDNRDSRPLLGNNETIGEYQRIRSERI